MTQTVFISDLHLDIEQPAIRNGLVTLLERHAGSAEALYVLGDLFESWIGDDDDSDFNRDIIHAFRRFSEAGPSLYFMHGNRDFLLGERFAREAGGTLLPEGTVVDLYGRPTLLMHGDSLCTHDEKYQAFRAQVRDPAWQQNTLAQPLEQRRMLAQMMRMQSKAQNQNKAENIMDVTPEEVVRKMETAGVLDLIHGHTHRPAVHDVPLANGTGKRWVLGDWGRLGWKLVADAHGNRLESFEL